jgi:hypothetical protein
MIDMKRFVCHINNFLYYYDMHIDKPLQFIKLPVITLIFVMLLGLLTACDTPVLEAVEEDDEGLEYTTVEYSKDGKEIRLYLDGVGVPVTRSQRAITKELAMMAYDYIEVIFVGGTPTRTVRTAWELGYPANINDIAREFNYNTICNSNAYDTAVTIAACMFVGKKDGKVLLGVGRLTDTRPSGLSPTTVYNNTTSVTFSISTLKSGLEVGTYSNGTPTRSGVATDSFRFNTSVTGTYTDNNPPRSNTGTTANSFLHPLGGTEYPVYMLVNPSSLEGEGSVPAVDMTYSFRFVDNADADITTNYRDAIRHVNTDGLATNPAPTVQRRMPRYPYNGGYMEPKNLIDTTSQIIFTTTFTTNGLVYQRARDNGPFVSNVRLRFNIPVLKRGIFAFNLQMPVFMVSRTLPYNAGGTEYETWYIRTGVGSEFYSLDDGITRGGCVLMSVGIDCDNFYSVEWTWFK